MQKNESAFQQSITQDELERITQNAFPGEDLRGSTEIKSGRFNTTYKLQVGVRDPVILRIAPNPNLMVYTHERNLLRREHSIHPYIASASNLVPKILFSDFSREIIERDYTVQSFIEGTNGDENLAQQSLEENITLWKLLTDISTQIGQVEGKGFGLPDPNLQFSTWSLALINIMENMIADVDRFSMDTSSPKDILKIMSENTGKLDAVSKPKLSHGDLWPKNTLVNKDEGVRITGLLDYERAFWGDPNSEWIITGSHFADQESKDGYVFRCGLFSADYTEMPAAVAEKYASKTSDELFRDQVYLGIYLTLRRLEAQRNPRNEKWIEDEFEKVLKTLYAL